MGLVGKMVGGIIITAVCGGIIYGTLRYAGRTMTENAVMSILDTNLDGKLSSEEIKRFYDETGISPYNEKALKLVPLEEQKKFVSNYQRMYQKKSRKILE